MTETADPRRRSADDPDDPDDPDRAGGDDAEHGEDPLRRLLSLGLDLPPEPTGARRRPAAHTGRSARPARDPGHRHAGAARPASRRTSRLRGGTTAVDPAPSGADGGARGPGSPPSPSTTSVPPPSRALRRRTAFFAGSLAVLVVVGAVLGVAGWRVVRDSTAGQRIDPTTDPSAPGFEGFVDPSPTTLVVHQGSDGLASLAVLALRAGDAGGSVLLLPPTTVWDPAAEAPTLVDQLAAGGVDALRSSVEAILGIGLGEVSEVDDARWAELVAPVAPLELANPDAVGEFPAGPIQLAADQVGPYLVARGEQESDLNRLVRQQVLWEAWIAAVAGSASDDPVPGERDAGLGRFVRGLAAGPLRAATLPVADDGFGRFVVDVFAVHELVGALVPFPVAAEPGARTRVRLLDGTGDPDLALRAAPLVVPAGAQIVLAGNASRFDYATTEVRYHDAALEAAADQLVTALGVGAAVLDPRPTDTVDVTIVVGDDLAGTVP